MFNLDDYTIIAHLFPRLLGLVYFFAFGAFIFQVRGLLGSQGILPITAHLKLLKSYYGNQSYYRAPSLFWINASDTFLVGVVWVGTLLSLLLVFGIYPSLMLILLYILYLSIDSIGQDFLSFGWEGFLLEITFYTFLLSLTSLPNMAVWISLNLLLFRFHFQAGAVKLQSRDKSWRNMSALSFHYQTQPIPNLIAWYIHKFPLWFHKASSYLMFIFELIVPFGIFLTEDIRLLVFVCLFGLQLTIWATGNFSFLNHLTMVLTTVLLNNKVLEIIYPFQTPFTASTLMMDVVLTLVGTIFVILQLVRLWTHFFPDKDFIRWLDWFLPFNLVCRYGIFAVMTTTRYEVIIEGSEDLISWKEYLFKAKPSELSRRPRRISPFQPRIDWQIWFLPFTSFSREVWFQQFLFHLLKGNRLVLKLLRYNPFPDKPPKYIRAVLYEYSFTSFKERWETKNWWKRTFIGFYSPTLSLKKD